MQSIGKIFLTSLLLILLLQCTHNPFENDETITRKANILKGKVEMNYLNSPEKVFVWLEGFNISTWTDTLGDFKIKIPPREIQTGGGITGALKLFFFVSNFKLDSATVALQNGELQFSYGDFDDSGYMRRQKRLVKTLNILTEVMPKTIQENYDGYISVELILQAIDDRDTVYVKYPDKAEGPLAVFFFQRRDSNADTLITYEKSLFVDNADFLVDSISTVPKVWSTGFQYSPGFLQKGEYEVIPFFIISGQPVPVALLNNFGEEIDRPGADYLKVPTTRNRGILTVKPKGDTN